MTKTNNRVRGIDFARGLSGFLIPAAHTLLIYGSTYTQDSSWLGSLVHFFGKWAGIFLIAMGFSYVISKTQSIQLSIKRAIKLLALGYLMNFLKFIVPAVLDLLPTNFIEAYGWTGPLSIDQMVYMVLTGDILQLAGVSLLLLSVINVIAKNKFIPLVLAIVMLALTDVVRGIHIGIAGIDYILDLLWGGDWNVYFAVFPWFGYILIGMFFGLWFLEKERDQDFIFKMMLYIGIVTTILGGILCEVDYDFHMRDYFHLGIGGFLYLLGFNLMMFWIGHIIVSKTTHNKFFEFLNYCSKKITSMYIIQWVLICLAMGVLGYRNKGVVGILLLMPVFTLATIGVQKLWDKRHLVYQTRRLKKLKVG